MAGPSYLDRVKAARQTQQPSYLDRVKAAGQPAQSYLDRVKAAGTPKQQSTLAEANRPYMRSDVRRLNMADSRIDLEDYKTALQDFMADAPPDAASNPEFVETYKKFQSGWDRLKAHEKSMATAKMLADDTESEPPNRFIEGAKDAGRAVLGGAESALSTVDAPDRFARVRAVETINRLRGKDVAPATSGQIWNEDVGGFGWAAEQLGLHGWEKSAAKAAPKANPLAIPDSARQFMGPEADRAVGEAAARGETMGDGQGGVEAALRGTTGFAADMALSPSTFLTGGVVRGAKTAQRQFSKIAKRAGLEAEEAKRFATRATALYGKKGGTAEFKPLMQRLLAKSKVDEKQAARLLGPDFERIGREGVALNLPFTEMYLPVSDVEILRNYVFNPAYRGVVAPLQRLNKTSWVRRAKEGFREIDAHSDIELFQLHRRADALKKEISNDMARKWEQVERSLPQDADLREELVRFAVDPGYDEVNFVGRGVEIPDSILKQAESVQDPKKFVEDWVRAKYPLPGSTKAGIKGKPSQQWNPDEVLRVKYEPDVDPWKVRVFTRENTASPNPYLALDTLSEADKQAVEAIRGFYGEYADRLAQAGIKVPINELTDIYIPRAFGAKGKEIDEAAERVVDSYNPRASRKKNPREQRPLGTARNDPATAQTMNATYDPRDITDAAIPNLAKTISRAELGQWIAKRWGIPDEEFKGMRQTGKMSSPVSGLFEEIPVDGKVFHVRKDLLDSVQRQAATSLPGKVWNKAMNAFKKYMTIPNLGYHATNMMGDTLLMMQGGMRRPGKSFDRARTVLSDGTKDSTILFRTPQGGRVTVGQVRRQLREAGIRSTAEDHLGRFDMLSTDPRADRVRRWEAANKGEKAGPTAGRRVETALTGGMNVAGEEIVKRWDEFSKTALLLDKLEKGMPPRLALKEVFRALPDYGASSRLLEGARKAVGFPTWRLHMLKEAPRLAANAPAYPLGVYRLNANVLGDPDGHQPGDFMAQESYNQPLNPDIVNTLFPGLVNPWESLTYRIREPNMESMMPMYNALRSAVDKRVPLSEGAESVTRSLLPPFQMAYEALSNRDMLSQQPRTWTVADGFFPSGTFPQNHPLEGLETPTGTESLVARYLPSFVPPLATQAANAAMHRYTDGRHGAMFGRQRETAPDEARRQALKAAGWALPTNFTVTTGFDKFTGGLYSPEMEFSTREYRRLVKERALKLLDQQQEQE